MEPKKKLLPMQFFICVLLLIFCVVLRFSPENAWTKTKNSVRAILTVHTDFRAEWQKIKNRFAKDEALAPLAPVSGMAAPASGKVIKGFGMQDASENDFHYGVVLSCEGNENILAANDGTVTDIATNSEYGSFIVIKHSEEITTLYGSLNEILPGVGESVSKGQPIARPEDGKSFYFELRRGDTYLNPAEYIDFGEASHD